MNRKTKNSIRYGMMLVLVMSFGGLIACITILWMARMSNTTMVTEDMVFVMLSFQVLLIILGGFGMLFSQKIREQS